MKTSSSAESNGRGAQVGLPQSTAYTLRAEMAGRTDVGQRRRRNEDNYLLMPSRRLAVVADGMGGRPCGDLASELGTGTVGEFFRDLVGTDATWPYAIDARLTEDENHLATALRSANREIHGRSVELTGKEGMLGTTLVAALLSQDGQSMSVAHVGDSRCYRIRDGRMVLLTRDHSLANEMAERAPWLTPAAVAQLPKNVLTRALGLKAEVKIDVYTEDTRAGDVYLLCSDGLWGHVDPEAMVAIVDSSPSLDDACARLVDLANENGGADNITVVLARVTRAEPPRRSGLALRAIRDESTYDGEPDLEWDR
jgi:protein phosphatase